MCIVSVLLKLSQSKLVSSVRLTDKGASHACCSCSGLLLLGSFMQAHHAIALPTSRHDTMILMRTLLVANWC